MKAEKSFPVRKSCVFWVHPTGAPKNDTSLFNLPNVLATLFLLIREAFKKKIYGLYVFLVPVAIAFSKDAFFINQSKAID